MQASMQVSSLTLKELVQKSLESEQLIDNNDIISILSEATNYTASYIKTLTPEQLFGKLSVIINQMERWYNDFNNKRELFEKRRYLNYRLVSRQSELARAVEDVKGREVSSYFKNKSINLSKEYEKYKQDLLKSFLQGFALWEAFRSYATGQSINYSILYKENKILYEARAITLEELLNRGNFSLSNRLNSKGEMTYSIVLSALDPSSEREEIFAGTTFYNQLLNKYRKYIKNEGAIYETYEEIRQNFRDFPVERGVTEKWFSYPKMNKTLIRKMMDNDLDWSSGRRAGDQGLTQNKNISKNAAQLSAIQTLPKDISELINVFKSGTKQELLNTLIRLLTEDVNKSTVHLSGKTEELNELAKQEIIKNFS